MSINKKQRQLYIAKINSRSTRERVAILLVILVLMLVGWDYLFVEPGLTARRELLQKVGQVNAQIAALREERKAAEYLAKADPDQENRQQIRQLQELIGTFDRKLEARLITLMSPQEMPGLLQRLLEQKKGLHLIALENSPPESILPPEEGGENPSGLYRHAMRMELEGSYLSLLRYLEALEKMPQGLFWDLLEIDAKDFPKTRIHLQIHTLSLTKDWIGV